MLCRERVDNSRFYKTDDPWDFLRIDVSSAYSLSDKEFIPITPTYFTQYGLCLLSELYYKKYKIKIFHFDSLEDVIALLACISYRYSKGIPFEDKMLAFTFVENKYATTPIPHRYGCLVNFNKEAAYLYWVDSIDCVSKFDRKCTFTSMHIKNFFENTGLRQRDYTSCALDTFITLQALLRSDGIKATYHDRGGGFTLPLEGREMLQRHKRNDELFRDFPEIKPDTAMVASKHSKTLLGHLRKYDKTCYYFELCKTTSKASKLDYLKPVTMPTYSHFKGLRLANKIDDMVRDKSAKQIQEIINRWSGEELISSLGSARST